MEKVILKSIDELEGKVVKSAKFTTDYFAEHISESGILIITECDCYLFVSLQASEHDEGIYIFANDYPSQQLAVDSGLTEDPEINYRYYMAEQHKEALLMNTELSVLASLKQKYQEVDK